MSADIKKVELTIALPPREIGKDRKAIERKLNQLKSRYIPEADGVLLNWHDLEVLNNNGIVIDDQPFVFWKVSFTANIFKPIEGKIIKGRVQKLLKSYFLASTMESFTVTVTISDSLVDSEVVQKLMLQQEVYFRIKGSSEGVYRAELDEECMEMTNNLEKTYDYAEDFDQTVSFAVAESCHLREFDLCMTSAVVFVQQPQGTKVNEAEIEKQCNLFRETEQCLEEFTERCMTPLQDSLVDFMSGGVLKYMREYCKKGSNLRKTYLKHGDCVQKQRKNMNKCLIDFQAAIEKSTLDDTHWRDRPRVLCCALDRLQNCNNAILEPACGKEAVDVGNTLIRGMFSRAATLTCEKYRFNSVQCQGLLPPTGTKPKGGRSNSVMSKLISTVTQV